MAKTLEEMHVAHEELDCKLAEVGNLVAALQIVLWDVAQRPATGHAAVARDALVGIGNALEAAVKR